MPNIGPIGSNSPEQNRPPVPPIDPAAKKEKPSDQDPEELRRQAEEKARAVLEGDKNKKKSSNAKDEGNPGIDIYA